MPPSAARAWGVQAFGCRMHAHGVFRPLAAECPSTCPAGGGRRCRYHGRGIPAYARATPIGCSLGSWCRTYSTPPQTGTPSARLFHVVAQAAQRPHTVTTVSFFRARATQQGSARVSKGQHDSARVSTGRHGSARGSTTHQDRHNSARGGRTTVVWIRGSKEGRANSVLRTEFLFPPHTHTM